MVGCTLEDSELVLPVRVIVMGLYPTVGFLSDNLCIVRIQTLVFMIHVPDGARSLKVTPLLAV